MTEVVDLVARGVLMGVAGSVLMDAWAPFSRRVIALSIVSM